MHHGITDLDTGGEAVGQHAARLALQHRQQGRGQRMIARIDMQGAGQLAFKAVGDGQHLCGIARPHDQTQRAEHLMRQGRIGQPVIARNAVKIGRGLAVLRA